jgi:hypothetical protein
MGFSRYHDLVRRAHLSTQVFLPELETINLVLRLESGVPANEATTGNPHGDTLVYLHYRARIDQEPQAVYQDESDSFWIPLSARLQSISLTLLPVVVTTSLGSITIPIGSHVMATYKGVDGVFVPLAIPTNAYGIDDTVGARLIGSWSSRVR